MSNWTYHTPSKSDEVGPGYEPGMECEYDWRKRPTGWETINKPTWSAFFTYRYRWATAKPVEEVPEWAIEKACELIGMAKFDESLGEKAATAFARYIATKEAPPEDPFERVTREMFDSILGWEYSDGEIAKTIEALRKHMPALVAALKGDTE